MNILVLLIIVFALVALFGNPWMGPRVYPGYSMGYWPGGLGIVIIIILVLYLSGRL